MSAHILLLFAVNSKSEHKRIHCHRWDSTPLGKTIDMLAHLSDRSVKSHPNELKGFLQGPYAEVGVTRVLERD
jgi:hypothetical protein